jgi:cytochrome b subunit of formate dehydrogenase
MGVLSKQGRLVESDKTCGKCHEEKLARYRETYHGKAMALGEGKVAACFDCHGTHDIYSSDDPRSLIFRGVDKEGVEKDTLITTCQKCHPNAGPKFAGYSTHADHSDSKKFPLLYWVYVSMTGLILGTFGFFGLHTITWLSRTLYFRFKDPVGFKEAKIRIKEDDETFTRFTPIDRFLHGLVIISFLTLVITGMPIKFYETEWAKVMFTMLGGSQTARSLHRLGAFITGIYFAVHIIVVTRRTFAAWLKSREQHDGKLTWKGLKDIILGPDSPIPNKQDWTDLVAHQKYFFGKGERPQFDRWTYWEKFDYWAVFWGVGVIGLSGLVMWAPAFFTKLLPGIAINIALIVHSDEALLAAGFIFTFHFFNVHFRPEKFPIDSVIFSGRISRAEMEHERGRQLERLTTEGNLEEARHSGDEWEAWKKIMHPLGYFAFGIGVVLIVMIYVAMGTRLFGN